MLAKVIIDVLTAAKAPVLEDKLREGLATINPGWDVLAELDQLHQQGKIAKHRTPWLGQTLISLPGPHKLKLCKPRVGAVYAIQVTDETLRDGIDHPGLTRKLSCFITPGGACAGKSDWIVLHNGKLVVFNSPAFLEHWETL